MVSISKVEYIAMPWAQLQQEMRMYFTTRPNKIVLRRNFEAKRWRRNEKFVEYFHEKVRLGNLADIDEQEMVDYVIDGFDDMAMQNQARIANFQTLDALVNTMKNVTERTTIATRAPVANYSRREAQTRKPFRCYNCNQEGHVALAPNLREAQVVALSADQRSTSSKTVPDVDVWIMVGNQDPAMQQPCWSKRDT